MHLLLHGTAEQLVYLIPDLLTKTSRAVCLIFQEIEMLMPLSHQRQFTLNDSSRYKNVGKKYKWLPRIAFSNSEIFNVVFLEMPWPLLVVQRPILGDTFLRG